jgi:uncharacterized protein
MSAAEGKEWGASAMRIGLISDTHGQLRPEAVQALCGVERIIHAGDIGASEVLDALRALAPVHAVRGNNDRGAWARELPARLALELGGVRIEILHDLKDLRFEPDERRSQVVIAGHSHQPSVIERNGVLFVNPGSAGPRRFKLPVTIGYLTIARRLPSAEIQQLL